MAKHNDGDGLNDYQRLKALSIGVTGWLIDNASDSQVSLSDGVAAWLSEHPMEAHNALAGGVAEWMTNHPVSTYDALGDGARRGVEAWLDLHRDTIVAAIADRVARDRSYEVADRATRSPEGTDSPDPIAPDPAT